MAKTEFVYPGSDLDRSKILLSLLGSFWARTYSGLDQVRSLVDATAAAVAQNHRNLLEVVAAMSRYELPLFHTEAWTPIVLRKSQLNTALTNAVRFDQNANRFDGQLVFDGAAQTELYAFPLPDRLVGVGQIFNKIIYPSIALREDVDFTIDIDRGAIVFVTNPFDNDGFARRAVQSDGVQDEEITLWGFQGQFDYEWVFNQFAYALGIRLQTSDGYKQFINTILSGLIDGGASAKNLDLAFSALCGIPLVADPVETVEVVEYDASSLLIVTDKNVYKFNEQATPLVAVGDQVVGGTQLVRGFEINEFFIGNSYVDVDDRVTRPDVSRFLATNTYDTVTTENNADILLDLSSGCPPAYRPLSALALDGGFVSSCFYGDLVFENKELPLFVDAAHPSGYTMLRFPVGGFPADVDKFFDEIHARGIASAQQGEIPCFSNPVVYATFAALPAAGLSGRVYRTQDDSRYYEWVPGFSGATGQYVEITRLPVVKKMGTLAHLLDRRNNPDGEPTAVHLPKTINPLRFLVENVLRNNVFVVRIDVTALGQSRLGLYNVRHLRQILPPHTAMIVVFELTAKSDRINAETAIREAVGVFTGIDPVADTIDDSFIVDQGAVLTKLSGTCQ